MNVRGALWIPCIWLLLTGSRFVSQWLAVFGIGGESAAVEEGSPIDAVVFFALILSGIYVLNKRRVSLREFARNNRWLMVFLVYCLVSIVWSDFPFLSLKRWIKVLGHPVMALIVLTEPDPQQAVRKLLKGVAYVLIPLSICLIKYFPQIAQYWETWTGQAYYGGVTLDKNQLGSFCMNVGIFFFWNTLLALQIKNLKAKLNELIVSVGFLAMIWWVLTVSSSATSLSSMLVGVFTIWVVGLRFINKRYLGTYVVVAILVFVIAEPIFGIYGSVVHLLGRNVTLTGRTDLWEEVLKLQNNPIFGAGFESFWLGDRLARLWVMYPWHPLQVHDGYLEIYLSLGFVGLVLLVGQILGVYGKVRRDLLIRFEFGRLRLGYLLAIVVYNYTEAAFDTTAFVWTMFFLIAIDYPIPQRSRPKEPSGSARGGAVYSAGASAA